MSSKLFSAAKSFGLAIGKKFEYDGMTGSPVCFVVEGGPILIWQLGFMVDTLCAGTNTLKFSYTVYGGSITNLCTAVDTDAAAVGDLFIATGIVGDAIVKESGGIGILSTDYNHMPMLLSIGSIHTVWSATSTAGGGVAYMLYQPCSHYTRVHAE